MENNIQIFEDKKIRSVWDNEKEEWYFSVVDVVGALTDSVNARDYWYKMKKRMTDEEKSELSTICRQLKLKAPDGKMRLTDVAETELTNIHNPNGLEENKKVAKRGGTIAGNTRKEIEADTGKSVITAKNAVDFSKLIEDVVKDIPDIVKNCKDEEKSKE